MGGGGDVVESGSAAFSNKNAGGSKTISLNSVGVSDGNNGNNYNLTLSGNNSSTITHKTIKATFTADNKVYDGTKTATALGISDGKIDGDDVVVNHQSAEFSDKNVGTNKTISVSEVSLSGGDSSNYVIDSTSSTAKADITQKTIIANYTGQNKIYDGAKNATVSGSSSEIISGDTVSFEQSSALFSDKNVGEKKIISIEGISLKGGDSGNYVLQKTTSETQADITPKSLKASFTAQNKIYDGTKITTATGEGDAVVSGDNVIFSNDLAEFSDKNVGTQKTVFVSGIGLAGTDAANYSLQNTTASTTADITPAQLLLNLKGTTSKVYDGLTLATLDSSNFEITGWAMGEGGSSTKKTGDYVSKNVSENTSTQKGLVSTSITKNDLVANSNTDLSNYILPTQVEGKIGVITPKDLKVKVNDTTMFVTQNANNAVDQGFTYSGLQNGETAEIALVGGALTTSNRVYTGSSSHPVVGTYQNVYLLDQTPTSKNGNYNISVESGRLTVSPADKLLITVNSQTSTYGSQNSTNLGQANAGSVSAQYCLSAIDCNGANLVSLTVQNTSGNQWKALDNTGTEITFNTSLAEAEFSNAGFLKVGNYTYNTSDIKTVSATSFNGSETNGGVHTVIPKKVKVTATQAQKVYDGGTSVQTANIAIKGVLVGDLLEGDFIGGQYLSKNAGNSLAYTLNGVFLKGADQANYTIENQSISGSDGVITPKIINATFNGQNKIYDGSTNANVSGTAPTLFGDLVEVTHSSAVFTDKNVGEKKAISISGLSLVGADSSNYALESTTASSAADITPKALTATFSGQNKIYDGTTKASINGDSQDIISGDHVIFNSKTAEFSDKNVGVDKSITISDISLGGADMANYTLQNSTTSASASITQKSITASYAGQNKIYDGTNDAQVSGFSTDVIQGDKINFSHTLASFSDKNADNQKTINVVGISLTGDDAGNYTLNNTTANTTGSIERKTISTTLLAKNKVYDGILTASVSIQAQNTVQGDIVLVNHESATFENKNVGVQKKVVVDGLTLDGADAKNYQLTQTTGEVKADITPKSIQATYDAQNKIYDGNTKASVMGKSIDLINNDSVQFDYQQAVFSDKNVGQNKNVYISGASLSGIDASNYTLSNTSAQSNASIGQKPISLMGVLVADKKYDGNSLGIIKNNGYLSGLVEGEHLLTNPLSAEFSSVLPLSDIAVKITAAIQDGSNGLASNYYLLPVEDTKATIRTVPVTPTKNEIPKITSIENTQKRVRFVDTKISLNNACYLNGEGDNCFCEETKLSGVEICYVKADSSKKSFTR